MASGHGQEGSRHQDPDGLRADARRNYRSILEAAARVLAEDPAAGLQAVADVAEVSRPTIYRHFSTREDLVAAIRREAISQAQGRLEAAAASDGPAAEGLETLIIELSEIVARYPLVASMTATETESEEKPPERFLEAFGALVARGRQDGTLRPDLQAETLAPITIGALSLAFADGRRRGADPREVGAEVAAIVLDGARSAESGKRWGDSATI